MYLHIVTDLLALTLHYIPVVLRAGGAVSKPGNVRGHVHSNYASIYRASRLDD